ncbi:MAG: protein arginine phosphatase [Gaiellaceae bacterium]|jgi:protein-tyrosine-phosphatase|nr:protein arginine phosphatase [Gaiellaceae bacterium]
MTAAPTLSILVVCTANRFRSPLVAAVLEQELDGLPVEVRSRGINDVGAMPPLSQALETASGLGIDIARHRARQLGTEDLQEADVVIGFERSHLVAAGEAGAVPGGVFGLEELVTALERLDRPPGLRNYASSVRANLTAADLLRDPDGSILEIEDPVKKTRREAAEIAERIHALSLRLAELLTP